MNVNSRIDWHIGMELTAQTFIEFDENIARKQQVVNQITNGNQFGIIPASEFNNKGVFVKNTLEIEHLSCIALLASGQILHIDERVVIPIPILYGDEYFLAGGLGQKQVGLDKDSVPFIKPECVYGIYALSELEKNDLFPIMKFKVQEGVFSIDNEYIPPCLILESDDRFQTYIQQYIERITVLAEHPNLELGEGKRAFMHYAFLLKNYNLKNRVQNFIQLMCEIAQAIDYYIVIPNVESGIEIQPYSSYDVVAWLRWLDGYIRGAASILDKVVLKKQDIDFEELKAQIKSELYQRLYTELYEKLYKELGATLRDEILRDLHVSIMEYINGKLKKDIHDLLVDELSEELYNKLYRMLYDSLFNALYVPKEEEVEEEFMPLI